MPVTLGLSSFYHDSAAAIVVDGQVVAAVQEERCSRIKADASFPQRAIDECLSIAGVTVGQVDHVAFYEIPALKFDRLIETFLAAAPRGFGTFRAAMPSWLATKLKVRDHVRRQLGPRLAQGMKYCPHHLAHAASAFYPSPYDEAAILTIDGVGEWATAGIFHGCGRNIKPLAEQRFPHSLGLLYSAVTTYCGFEINSGEYKLMGLAASGQPRLAAAMLNEMVRIGEDGSVRLDQSYFDYCHGWRMTSAKFDRFFGRAARRVNDPIDELDRDLAASVQAITELAMAKMTRYSLQQTGTRRLCLAGGVALNCVAVGRLVSDGVVDELWVQPAAGDAGGAVGAALWLAHEHLQIARSSHVNDSFRGGFLGTSYNDSEIQSAIARSGLASRVVQCDVELCDQVAKRLASGAIVGWFQGAMEFGPRALGHRSILADPRDAEMRDRVNAVIKHRESFRPFAPAVLRERLADFFAVDGRAQVDLPYMTTTVTVTKPDLIPAVTHVDGSARVQTVDRDRNPLFAMLIESFGRRTGVPVLLNTSFNDRDEPIVCTPDDALACFLATGLDLLVIGKCVLEKPHNSELSAPQPVPAQSTELQSTLTQFSQSVWTFSQRLAWPLRWLGSLVSLGLVYFLLITPIGCWRRLRGHRPLDQVGWLPFTAPQQPVNTGESEFEMRWWVELLLFLREEKKWWLLPIAASLLVVTVAASFGGTVAPWIYAIW